MDLDQLQAENQKLRDQLAAAEKSNAGMREAVGRWQARAQAKKPAKHEETLVSIRQKMEFHRDTGRERWREYRTIARDIMYGQALAGPHQIIEVRMYLEQKIISENPMAQLVSVEFKNETWTYTTAQWL